MDWLEKELQFIHWLYKYKTFLGTLKRKEFKDFPTRKDAWKIFEEEIKNVKRDNE